MPHKNFKPPNRVPEYQQFVDDIGIDPERDLDQVAIALHRMPDPNGPNGPVAYSMVLVGRITGPRFNAWLDAHATSRETYVGHTIYNITSQDRTVRVAQIGYDAVAISNTPTAEQIHSMLDRHRAAALPFSGSSLLERHYHDVPLLSLAWGVGQIGLPFSESGSIHIFGFALAARSRLHHHRQRRARSPRSRLARRAARQSRGDRPQRRTKPPARPPIWPRSSLSSADSLSATPQRRANDAFQELLKNAEVTQHGERVVITATIAASTLAHL